MRSLNLGGLSVLAMGQRSTDGVNFINRQRCHDGKPYLDNLIGVSPPSTAADGFEQLGTLLCDLGLEEHVPKACPPASLQVVLGIVIGPPKGRSYEFSAVSQLVS